MEVPLSSGTAACVHVGGAADSVPEGEILAAIELVTRGVAVRVSLTGWDLTVERAQEAVEMAEAAGCGATIRIGEGGRLGLVIATP